MSTEADRPAPGAPGAAGLRIDDEPSTVRLRTAPRATWSVPEQRAGSVLAPPSPPYPPDPAAVPAGPRGRARAVVAAVCLILGVGLICGAVAGSWLTRARGADSAAERDFALGGSLWRTVPVDELFPPAVHGANAGPGGAERDWIRVGVAPDGDCAGAFDAALARVLAPAGCARLLRATYTDATSTSVTTVGLLVTTADSTGMRALRERFAGEHLDERPEMLPRPYAPRGTAAERFGDTQRAAWHIGVLTDAPAVVYTVTGFADGRTVTTPQPAARALAPRATTAPAQAGLGHEATALAERMEEGVRAALRRAVREDRR
ncbi:hypothetical protein ACFP1Z_23835 [Streptomyces gamaensis]|uniref:Secreted protein n=1 Tax=Streptomyces gamaensis TaxID=1763542 RepID=A0ABW0Z9D0_9ACTN